MGNGWRNPSEAVGEVHLCTACNGFGSFDDEDIPVDTDYDHSCLTSPEVIELMEAAKDALDYFRHPKEVPFTDEDVANRLRTALAAFKGEK